MNDHNLDDLIIDNIAPKSGKTKSILTILALLIVVLIIAIILTKIILKDPNAEQLALEEDTTEMISPELTLQNNTQKKETKEAKEETKLSAIIENEPKAPVKSPLETPKTETVKTETIKPTQEKVEITKEFAQEATAEKKPEEKTNKKPLPEKIIEKAKEQPAGRPAIKPTSDVVVPKGYFIQVGSFAQAPSSRFLGIIKNSGFDYIITPPVNGTKKLLIGPYSTRKTADTALVRVKDRINKRAFVIKK